MGASLSGLDPDLAAAGRALDDAVRQSGFVGAFTSGLRSSSEQGRLYRRYLAGRSQFPAVPPGASAHQYGLAFDYIVRPFQVELQRQIGEIWVSWGGGWSPRDSVHFELPGASDAAMQAFLDAGGQLGPQGESLGARASGIVTAAQDLYLGSNAASLLRLIPGLSENEALTMLSSPFETFQKWLISSIKIPGLR